MQAATWYFDLNGEVLDVEELVKLFRNEVDFGTGTSSDGSRCLILKLDFTASDARLARDVADEVLSKLNGVAHVVYGNHRNIRLGGVYVRERPDGPLNTIAMIEGTELRMRMGSVGDETGRKAIGDAFLEAADRDEYFDRALFLYGAVSHDWRGLYMVLEAAEDGNGGEKRLIAKGWAAPGAIRDFKATANSYRALGRNARHGSTKEGVPAPTQTLAEARQMIRVVLERWSNQLNV
jgi:hypothetical protein